MTFADRIYPNAMKTEPTPSRQERFHDRMKDDPRFLVLLAAATTAIYTGAFDKPDTHDTEDDEHWTADWLAFRVFICAEAVYKTTFQEEDEIEKFNAAVGNNDGEKQ